MEYVEKINAEIENLKKRPINQFNVEYMLNLISVLAVTQTIDEEIEKNETIIVKED